MSPTHADTPKHPYHLVDPSPWPIVGAIAAGTVAVGLVLYMHNYTPWVLPVGIILLLATMALWFRDVIKEATFQGYHTPVVQIGMRYGMALFIASEVMFFAAFFWAYFNASLFPTDAIGNVWPPKNIRTFDPLSLPLLNTLILLTSGVTVTWAHHALREGDRQGMLQGLALTIHFKDGIYPSTFFMATGFHGFHVIIGTTFLIVCFFRARAGHFKPDHHFGFEAAAWYWHFVDVVWLFLFTCIYFFGAGPGPYAGH